MTHVYIAVFFSLIMAGCATIQEVRRLDNSTEYSVSCWYFDWSMCFAKANELCPGGYNFLSQEMRSNGKEMRFACPDAK
jgi:hypothetical protein